MEAIFILAGAAVTWLVQTIWFGICVLFWLIVGIVGASFIAFLFRRESVGLVPTVDPVEAVRKALREGQLDGDIARVNRRNEERGRP